MWNAWLEEAQAGIKTTRRNINNHRYTNDTTLMAESKELKSLLINVKEESEKSGLKLNIQKTKIMVSSLSTSWQIDGVKMETVTDFISWAPKSLQTLTAAMKWRRLFLGRKALTNQDTILKSRDITLLAKIYIDKAIGFPVVMYGCESRTMKKAEHQRIYAFKLWCCRRLLRVPWMAGWSNQSILKEINPL